MPATELHVRAGVAVPWQAHCSGAHGSRSQRAQVRTVRRVRTAPNWKILVRAHRPALVTPVTCPQPSCMYARVSRYHGKRTAAARTALEVSGHKYAPYAAYAQLLIGKS